VPCEDTGTFDNEVKTEISQDLGDNHQHQDADLCSPFCICQCCHINATYFKFAEIKFEFKYNSSQDFLYLNGIKKDFIPFYSHHRHNSVFLKDNYILF